MPRKIDGRDLFGRFANSEETFDDDWLQDMQETIRIDGDRVGRQEWDSGGPGAGAGISCVYLFRDLFFSEDDAGMFGPFGKFIEAAEAVSLLGVNEATTGVWVASEYRVEAEKAVELFDGISKEQAAALFSSDESSWKA